VVRESGDKQFTFDDIRFFVTQYGDEEVKKHIQAQKWPVFDYVNNYIGLGPDLCRVLPLCLFSSMEGGADLISAVPSVLSECGGQQLECQAMLGPLESQRSKVWVRLCELHDKYVLSNQSFFNTSYDASHPQDEELRLNTAQQHSSRMEKNLHRLVVRFNNLTTVRAGLLTYISHGAAQIPQEQRDRIMHACTDLENKKHVGLFARIRNWINTLPGRGRVVTTKTAEVLKAPTVFFNARIVAPSQRHNLEVGR
jgi:hypothetical protein